MRGRVRVALVVLVALAISAGCKRSDPRPEGDAYAAAAPLVTPTSRAAVVVKEALPRCRAEGARVAIPGEDVVSGDAVVTGDALLIGAIRREGPRRIASVVRASLDLTKVTVLDVGSAPGDDPPPSPRLRGRTAFVASFARGKGVASAQGDSGPDPSASSTSRILQIARVDGGAIVVEGTVAQQADESLAFDLAWPEEAKGPPLVAWDEDAPRRAGAVLADHGVVKVQRLGSGEKPRVVSSANTDAEAPRLLMRRGGYWLAWLARRPEAGEDAGVEGPGETRANRWVEVVSLDANGEATAAVRRVSPEKGHVASFELASAGPDAKLVILVQDETALAEGAGERVVRYALASDRTESADLLDGGVGHSLVELLAPHGNDAGSPRWLAFTDLHEHAHLVPLGSALELAGAEAAEPSLDGARIVATLAPDLFYAVGDARGRAELRLLVCR